jgi:hypothetical protein
LSVERGKDGGTYVELNEDAILSIQDKQSEDRIVPISGRVKSFDRDSGVGKVASPEFHRVLNFVVPIRDRVILGGKILEAMTRDTVLLYCRRVVDKSGQPTSLVLIDIDLGPNAADE